MSLRAIAAEVGAHASRVPGVFHVCGHDVHAAIGVRVASVLASERQRLPGTALFLFQPAEETLPRSGAHSPARCTWISRCGRTVVGAPHFPEFDVDESTIGLATKGMSFVYWQRLSER